MRANQVNRPKIGVEAESKGQARSYTDIQVQWIKLQEQGNGLKTNQQLLTVTVQLK